MSSAEEAEFYLRHRDPGYLRNLSSEIDGKSYQRIKRVDKLSSYLIGT